MGFAHCFFDFDSRLQLPIYTAKKDSPPIYTTLNSKERNSKPLRLCASALKIKKDSLPIYTIYTFYTVKKDSHSTRN